MTYRVAEVFRSLQGEGRFTGTPSAFIRLHGCSVGCPWCDSAYTWREPPEPIAFGDLVQAPPERPVVAEVCASALRAWVEAQGVGHVVVTGGEPCEQELLPLVEALEEERFIQVETSGTMRPSVDVLRRVHWWTVSPKIGMPGGCTVDPVMVHRADELKMPVGRERDVDALLDLIAQTGTRAEVWLQPLSLSASATALCIEAAARHGWRVSLQTHKLAGMR